MPVDRRADFDSMMEGWGSDAPSDLIARSELLSEYWHAHMPLSQAEHKIAKAFMKRLGEVTGLEFPEFN